MGCRENRCLVVWGEGENECSTRTDCAPPPPKIRTPEPTPKKEEPKPKVKPILIPQELKERFESVYTIILRKIDLLD